MKLLFYVLITTGITATSLQAQSVTSSKNSRWGAGVFAGLNYSYPRVDMRYPAHFSPHANLLAGVDLNYSLNPRASLHVQPSWTRIRNVSPNGYSRSLILSVTSIKIPLMYRYYVLPAHRSLFVEAGVSYNRIAQSDYREDSGLVCITSPCPAFYMPNRPASVKSAISSLAGIGVNIDVQKVSIPITLRYERYISSYQFPSLNDRPATPVQFENFSLTTGVNF